MKRSGPLRRNKPLTSRGRLKRRTPLKPMSKKRRLVASKRAKMVNEELQKRPVCEAGPVIREYRHRKFGHADAQRLSDSWGCHGWAKDIHEPLTRARGGDILDPHNTVAVCRNCHDWIHSHPKAATQLGLLKGGRD